VPPLTNMVLALIFYDLFKIVNRSLAALVVFLLLVGSAIECAGLLGHYAPLILLGDESGLTAFDAGQISALVQISLGLQTGGFALSLVFFAFYDFAVSRLTLRSTFLPRVLGWLMAAAGVCYLTNSVAIFLWPAFAVALFPYVLLVPFVGELSFALWLFVFGVNASRWEEQAGAANV